MNAHVYIYVCIFTHPQTYMYIYVCILFEIASRRFRGKCKMLVHAQTNLLKGPKGSIVTPPFYQILRRRQSKAPTHSLNPSHPQERCHSRQLSIPGRP